MATTSIIGKAVSKGKKPAASKKVVKKDDAPKESNGSRGGNGNGGGGGGGGGNRNGGIGVRIGDRERNQRTANMQTSTRAVSGSGLTNKNDLFPSFGANVIRDQRSDSGVLMRQRRDPSSRLIEETQTAAKRRAGVRTGTRAGAAAGSLGVGYGAGELINEKTKKPETKTKTVVVDKDERASKKDYPTYKKDTPSSKAFKDAFKTAKDENKASFTFEGRKYNTKDKK